MIYERSNGHFSFWILKKEQIITFLSPDPYFIHTRTNNGFAK